MIADLEVAGSSRAKNLLTKQEDNTAVHITVNLEQLCTLIMTHVCVLNLVQPFYF